MAEDMNANQLPAALTAAVEFLDGAVKEARERMLQSQEARGLFAEGRKDIGPLADATQLFLQLVVEACQERLLRLAGG